MRDLRNALQAREDTRRRFLIGIRAVAVAFTLAFTLAPQSPRPTLRISRASATIRPVSAAAVPPKVWLVEAKPGFEIYSNGLRIDNQFVTNTRARAYRPFDRSTLHATATESRPAGIVFHTTESRMLAFDPSENARLNRNGRNLVGIVAKDHLYHFVIDRFGRVFRAVAETDYANHAGHSIWMDDRRIYWGLNQSFLGVAFEAQTEPGSAAADAATPAQIDAARVLTEMLRAKYHIPAADCVTHAQVSINTESMRIGYHTDWAANFPFREVGLGDGYQTPVAALNLFGFDYDSSFLRANAGRVWPGLVSAEEQLVRDAAAHGVTVERYRRALAQKFREWRRTEASNATEESSGDRP